MEFHQLVLYYDFKESILYQMFGFRGIFNHLEVLTGFGSWSRCGLYLKYGSESLLKTVKE